MNLKRLICIAFLNFLIVQINAGDWIKSSENSVLSSGSWYKIKVQEDGIYKIDYNKLQEIGIDPSQINPKNIRIYGNGGGMLPENNSDTPFTDLQENAIFVYGEDDGQFNTQDYILFYGQSPHRWFYNSASATYTHQLNAYSDYTCYFITVSDEAGKRIEPRESLEETPTVTLVNFADHQFYEQEEISLINSGRTWYGEIFDATTSRSFDFTFPNIDASRNAKFKVDVAGRSSENSQFSVSVNGSILGAVSVSRINFSSSLPPYARASTETFTFIPDDDDLSLNLQYVKPNSSSKGWLNFIEMVAYRSLKYDGGSLFFRNPDYIGSTEILNFRIQKTEDYFDLWDVSDPLNVKKQAFSDNGTQLSFVRDADDLEEFVLFDETSFLVPEIVGEVENQNYHALQPADLIIVSPSEFSGEALQLGNYHEQNDGLSFCIVEPSKLYNEFSSGSQDISAIRNFVKLLYDRADAQQKPKYLLLFGDASFDYKDKIEDNNNFVPTWESLNGVDIGQSYMSDDFYGLLEDGEGENLVGDLDIGIGRLPVASVQEAQGVVDKIISYARNGSNVLGSWRKDVCLIGDDEDYNTYVNDSEVIAQDITDLCPNLNISKIYLDAYSQEATPGGERYPDVTDAINQTIEQGTLLVNYIGHGGETGWAHERILTVDDINAWDNINHLPVFITATCEFTRLDDPERKSAGEYVMTNPNGGGIALFTTTRATSAGANLILNRSVVNSLLNPDHAHEVRLGDVVCASKNAIGNTNNSKKFVLVGDPALKAALPSDSLAILKINNKDILLEVDTLKALTRVRFEGSVYDYSGNKSTMFNGTVYPILFDKPSVLKTLAQNGNSYEQEFEVYNNIIYNGKASVTDGDFTFEFIVPKDISYNYDFGKLSLYATDGLSDAWGSLPDLVVGGYDEAASEDIIGPEIKLFMNSESFNSGNQVSSSSILIASFSDESGINTLGTSIGHDITAVLDQNTGDPYILNDFYMSELDDFTKGSLQYRFNELENGLHSLDLKVWDVYNNSSTASIEFLVAESDQLQITHLLNYPNPFSVETTIEFGLSKNESISSIEIRIFNIRGQRVKTISKTNFGQDYVKWQGDADNGVILQPGFYFYRIVIQTTEGETAQGSGKILFVK